jgi:hypothetical protein
MEVICSHCGKPSKVGYQTWYDFRAKRVDNGEWKYGYFYGTREQFLDKKFNSEFIIEEENGSYRIHGVEIILETLEFKMSDTQFEKAELKERS